MLEYRAVPLKLKSYFARTPSPFSHNFLIMARLLTDSQLHIDIVSWHAGVGAVLSAAAPIFPVLILGKMVYGLGIGFALHAAPAYLAEVGHPRIRGLLIRQFPVCICVERHMCCCVLPCTPFHPPFNAQFHDECPSVSIWAVKFCVIIIPPSGDPCLFMHALHFLHICMRWTARNQPFEEAVSHPLSQSQMWCFGFSCRNDPRAKGGVVTCSMKEVFIGIGIELGYLIGLPCVSVMSGWRIIFGVALLFAMIMKTGMVSPSTIALTAGQARGSCVTRQPHFFPLIIVTAYDTDSCLVMPAY